MPWFDQVVRMKRYSLHVWNQRLEIVDSKRLIKGILPVSMPFNTVLFSASGSKHIHGKVDIFLAPQVLECSPQLIESFDGLSIHQAIYMASGNFSLVLWLLRMLINFYLCIYALEVRANECKFLHTCLSLVSHALRICQWHKRICTSWPNTSLIAFISTSLQSIIRRFRLKLHSFLSQ